MISAQERSHALMRAQTALRQLEQHEATSLRRLGAARDQLNIVWTRPNPAAVWAAVGLLERNLDEIQTGQAGRHLEEGDTPLA